MGLRTRVVLMMLIGEVLTVDAGDWPQYGGRPTRNPVASDARVTLDFDLETGRNIRWSADLGSQTFGSPIIAGGQVYIGTNNGRGYLERYPAEVDLGCLLCFRELDGEVLWQFSAEKRFGRYHDWPFNGVGASPLVEGDRLWFVSNRFDVVCLDTQGFRDGENDSPYQAEQFTDDNEADVVWQIDLVEEFGVCPHNTGMGPDRRCSPTSTYKNLIYIVTGNGVDETWNHVPAPEAPCLICLNKDTGAVVWTDSTPGENTLTAQLGDPLVVEIAGRGQVIVPQGDGWLRSFDALTGAVIWEFDMNFKQSLWQIGSRGDRNDLLAPAVYYKGRVYLASGQEAEHGDGPGRLVCIDITRTGDISSELAVDAMGEVLPRRRVQAVVIEQGERTIPNPNSGLVWEYTESDLNGNGTIDFEEEFHRTMSAVAIHDDLLIAGDFSGLVHCFHAQSGERLWVYDVFSSIMAAPLMVGDTVLIACDDGIVWNFGLSPDPAVAFAHVERQHDFKTAIHGSPSFANGTLYVATRHRLHAISDGSDTQALLDRELNHAPAFIDTDESDRTDRVATPPFLPTPHDIVQAMLEAGEVQSDDLVVDLGSGDGRIVIAAAKDFDARSIGYEIDAELIESSVAFAAEAGVDERCEFRMQDMYTADLSEVDVVTVYLYPAALDKLRPQFDDMPPGSRIVAHHFAIPDVEPTLTLILESEETGDEHRVFVYELPLRASRDLD